MLLNDYLRAAFGCKVYKISLSARVTCPNRDGTLGTGGCIFCSEGGSGEFAACAQLGISEQIAQAKARVVAKAGPDAKYIAYFQSYTNTYGDPKYLERIFREAMEPEEIVALSVGTRPDCLPEEILDMLERLSRIKPVWVELGLQTIHERSAKYIRRGYELPVYDDAVQKLHARGIHVITHLILGLPGESHEDMKKSLEHVVNVGSNGVKLQLLHVLKGTDLAEEYDAGKVPVMEFEEYIDLLCELVPLIPHEMVIHRLTGDGDKKLLIAPLWSADKKRVLNKVNQRVLPLVHFVD
ncbi:MAG: TIGR01212 family radical SAM protein [Lachnospiraceae bacterium]|nr:TIGR01212 family radical SAM protein [Lachnospiraceae bacterium]